MKNIIERIFNIGIDENFDQDKINAIKLLNKMALPVAILQTIINLQNLIFGEYIQLTIGLLILATTLSMFYFNHSKQSHITKFILNLVYPYIIFALQILYGEEFRVQFAYIIIIVTSMIFYKDSTLKYYLILQIITLYFIGDFYISKHQPILNLHFSLIDKHVILLCTVFGLASIINSYILENEKIKLHLKESMNDIFQKNKELVTLNNQMERFSYIASHDLKTPLRSIVSFLDIIEKKIQKNEYEEIQQYFCYVKDSSKQMNKLISEILNYNNMNMLEKLSIESLDLNDIAHHNISELKALIKEKNIEVYCDQLPKMKSNKLMVNLIFQKILENAFIFNKNINPKVTVTSKINENGVEVCISDNGDGIDYSYREKIFDLFTRLQVNKNNTGMGLALSKKAVEKINGKIWFDSKLGEGSNFYFFIPNL